MRPSVTYFSSCAGRGLVGEGDFCRGSIFSFLAPRFFRKEPKVPGTMQTGQTALGSIALYCKTVQAGPSFLLGNNPEHVVPRGCCLPVVARVNCVERCIDPVRREGGEGWGRGGRESVELHRR